MLLPLQQRLRRALLYDVATCANTSSNQASKDLSQQGRNYYNLNKTCYVNIIIQQIGCYLFFGYSNYFRKLYFGILVALHSSLNIYNITSNLQYYIVLKLALQPILAKYYKLAAFYILARLPTYFISIHISRIALNPKTRGNFCTQAYSICRKLANQLWQPRLRIITFTRLSLNLKMDLSETMQGLIAYKIYSSGLNSR